ncbi:galactonate transporter [Klebsiella pneumoniae subsp. ozaenae]|uniref:Galactonate transporter n=1 Tax=Klebsiella pneumoniae subsp. ozaenae TaxID=574 RepID=A0A378AGG7_KLEPO|nr:galactonate transporter [Klebsiella pneumoniae subsp. ozaenae]
MALAFFGKGFGALGWPVISDVAPKEIVGLCGGVFNVFGNVASIATPLVIGYIVSELHSFNGALIFCWRLRADDDGLLPVCGWRYQTYGIAEVSND